MPEEVCTSAFVSDVSHAGFSQTRSSTMGASRRTFSSVSGGSALSLLGCRGLVSQCPHGTRTGIG